MPLCLSVVPPLATSRSAAPPGQMWASDRRSLNQKLILTKVIGCLFVLGPRQTWERPNQPPKLSWLHHNRGSSVLTIDLVTFPSDDGCGLLLPAPVFPEPEGEILRIKGIIQQRTPCPWQTAFFLTTRPHHFPSPLN